MSHEDEQIPDAGGPGDDTGEPSVLDAIAAEAVPDEPTGGDQVPDRAAEAGEPDATEVIETDDATEVLESGDVTEVIETGDASDPGDEPDAETTAVLPTVENDATSIFAPVERDPDEADAAGEDEPAKRNWRKRIGIAALVTVALAGSYVGAAYALADRVPRDTTVLGTEIGSMTAAAAVVAIDDLNETWQAKAVAVRAGEQRATLDPITAGLSIDAQATVDAITGFSLDPRRLWLQVTGSGAADPVLGINDARLNAAVRALATELAVDPVDATAGFDGASLVTTPAITGHVLKVEDAKDAIEAGWLTKTRPIELPTTETEPQLTQEKLDRFVAESVDPLLAGPVTVTVGDHQIALEPAVLASAQAIVTESGDFVMTPDPQILHDAVMTLDPTLGTEPVNARFDWNDAGPVLVPGVDGVGIDAQAVSDAIMVATQTPERLAVTDAVPVPPEVTTEYLQSMGITERIVSFSTPLTSEPTRTRNIRHATEFISGTLVPPGGTFNTLEVIGPITAANGYINSGMVINGIHIDGMGGGLSQIGTTTFNAGFEAGYADLEHHPHLSLIHI